MAVGPFERCTALNCMMLHVYQPFVMQNGGPAHLHDPSARHAAIHRRAHSHLSRSLAGRTAWRTQHSHTKRSALCASLKSSAWRASHDTVGSSRAKPLPCPFLLTNGGHPPRCAFAHSHEEAAARQLHSPNSALHAFMIPSRF
jgi:hypothetical protein